MLCHSFLAKRNKQENNTFFCIWFQWLSFFLALLSKSALFSVLLLLNNLKNTFFFNLKAIIWLKEEKKDASTQNKQSKLWEIKTREREKNNRKYTIFWIDIENWTFILFFVLFSLQFNRAIKRENTKYKFL